MDSVINVAIADDNERIVKILEDMLGSDNEINVVGKAKNGEEAISIIKKEKPDVVLLDIIMPKLDGLTVMDKINSDKTVFCDYERNRPGGNYRGRL